MAVAAQNYINKIASKWVVKQKQNSFRNKKRLRTRQNKLFSFQPLYIFNRKRWSYLQSFKYKSLNKVLLSIGLPQLLAMSLKPIILCKLKFFPSFFLQTQFLPLVDPSNQTKNYTKASLSLLYSIFLWLLLSESFFYLPFLWPR